MHHASAFNHTHAVFPTQPTQPLSSNILHERRRLLADSLVSMNDDVIAKWKNEKNEIVPFIESESQSDGRGY